MNTLATLRVNSSVPLSSKILSGGDEKVLRLFEAPYSYVKIFNQLNPDHIGLRFSETSTNAEVERMIGSEVAKQPLGLMNKPILAKQRVDDEEGGGIGADFDPNLILSNTKVEGVIEDVVEPPVEDVLMSKTLWPEQQKLYGHAFEVFCITTSYRGDCAASASKAKDKKYADIIIWDLRKGQTSVPCCKLTAHNLTVVQMEFSKCDTYLLSCSRDRSWALFKRNEPDQLQFSLV
jgi:elongator complex protein 2